MEASISAFANPKLTSVTYKCFRRGDGLDHDSKLFLRIYEQGSNIVFANDLYVGGDGNGTVIKSVAIVRTIYKDELNGKVSRLEIQPNGHDKWEFDCIIEFQFEDGTYSSYNHGRIRLGNQDGWGHFHERALSNI